MSFDLLDDFHKSLNDAIPFQLWEVEINLRHTMRQIDCTKLKPERKEDLDLLLRALYFNGQPTDFFEIIFNNLENNITLNWLQQGPPWVLIEFLKFLPWHLSQNTMEPRRLYFLLHIFKASLTKYYRPILQVLDLHTLQALAARTANPDLRNLLRQQEAVLVEEIDRKWYGLYDSPPVFLDEKGRLVRQAIELLISTDIHCFSEPYGGERFNLLIQTADDIFSCGLVEDCLAMLIEIYQDYQHQNRLVTVLEDEKIYRSLHKLLRRVIPTYLLLYMPWEAYNRLTMVYKSYFPRFDPDSLSIKYLNLYERIQEGLNRREPAILAEILMYSQTITDSHSEELPLLLEKELWEGLEPDRVQVLMTKIRQKLYTLPNEAFIVMELLRLLLQHGLIKKTRETVGELLDYYLLLWKWVPAHMFLNNSIYEQLAPLTSIPTRQEAERIIRLADRYNSEALFSDLDNRPELFRKKSETIRRAILAGKVMGVS
ncbi:hypothetical protein [Syntrophomonas erecta]